MHRWIRTQNDVQSECCIMSWSFGESVSSLKSKRDRYSNRPHDYKEINPVKAQQWTWFMMCFFRRRSVGHQVFLFSPDKCFVGEPNTTGSSFSNHQYVLSARSGRPQRIDGLGHTAGINALIADPFLPRSCSHCNINAVSATTLTENF